MPNGGVTLVTYDTRVTSHVCGRVIYVHSDNTEVTTEEPLGLHKDADITPSYSYHAFHRTRIERFIKSTAFTLN